MEMCSDAAMRNRIVPETGVQLTNDGFEDRSSTLQLDAISGLQSESGVEMTACIEKCNPAAVRRATDSTAVHLYSTRRLLEGVCEGECINPARAQHIGILQLRIHFTNTTTTISHRFSPGLPHILIIQRSTKMRLHSI